MLIGLIFMAVACGSPGLCPTKVQLTAAVSRRDDHETESLAEEMREGNPTLPVSIQSERIVDITHIRCAQEWSDEPGWVNCSFRVRYPNRVVLEIAQISPGADGWVLQDWRRATLEDHSSSAPE